MKVSEVLGWIGGIAVLFALTVPWGSIGQKEAAKRAACLSDVKRQSLGLLQYGSDGDQGFPSRDTWMDDLLPYVKDELIFRDPVSYRDGISAYYGYAFNASLAKKRLAQSSDPLPLVYDSANPIRNASDLFTSLPVPGRHKARNNVAYSDGHALSVKGR